MTAPRGLGFWVAFEGEIDAGPKDADLRVAVARCKAAGASWVALRAGAGGGNDGNLTESSIQAFIAAGIDVYVWIFSYNATAAAEIAGYAKCLKWGAVGAIINAEFPYNVPASQAYALVKSIRALGFTFVAHAPPDYLGAGVGHPLRPCLVALDEVCDAIMPQVYPFEHDDSGSKYHLHRVIAGYNARGLGPDKVWPIGGTYRPRERGGAKLVSLPNQAQRVADDVLAFLADPNVKHCPAYSLYSLDAITSINGTEDKVMEALTARHAGESPDPITQIDLSFDSDAPAHPLGWADRAERDAEEG